MASGWKAVGVQLFLALLIFVCSVSLRDSGRTMGDLFRITTTVTGGIGPLTICSKISGLSPHQINICQETPNIFEAITKGYQLGAEECESQFKFNRWNCSRVGLKSIFGERAIPGTREAAFTHAIMSAGITYSVTDACTQGNLTQCGCDTSLKNGQESAKGWKWGGCSVDIDFGTKFAERFMAARGHDRRIGLMNHHNSRAGREVVSSNWKFACKCIGLSGSCAKQTCWRKLPSFRTLGDILKRAYIATAKVSAHMVDSHKGPVPGYLVLPSLQLQEEPEKPASTQLVYLNDSQDYCERDDTAGILGTEGRQCNRSSGGEDSCTMLCCGRGYDTFSVMVSRGCHCKFHWCCQIRCKVCRSREEIHRCK